MKLINKIGTYFNLSSLIVFLIIFIGLHLLVNNSIKQEANIHLKNITQKVVQEMEKGNAVNYPPYIEIVKVDSVDEEPGLEDVWIEFENEKNDEYFRQLVSYVKIDNDKYKVTARISLDERQDLFISITILIFSSLILFHVVMYFVNKFLSRKILNDFYNTISILEKFSISNKSPLNLKHSKIEEFDKLNISLNYLAEQAVAEYISLQEFTENLNHEIKTPIAVIKSKLELLFESPNRTKEELLLLNSAMKNLSKLQKVNKSLILLNQIDNTHQIEKRPIDVLREFKNIIENFEESIYNKNITIEIENNHKEGLLIVNVNHQLLNVLLSNLISNAIKHNLENGIIKIEIFDNSLSISNLGKPPKHSTENYFKRFYKESESSESIGLGLTIVKKICDLFSFKISYEYIENIHKISINFSDL